MGFIFVTCLVCSLDLPPTSTLQTVINRLKDSESLTFRKKLDIQIYKREIGLFPSHAGHQCNGTSFEALDLDTHLNDAQIGIDVSPEGVSTTQKELFIVNRTRNPKYTIFVLTGLGQEVGKLLGAYFILF